MNKKSISSKNRLLARTANEVRKYAILKIALRSALVCTVILLTLVYIVSVLYNKYGSFTVSINKYDAQKYSLSLCETPDFKNQITRLNAKTAEDITNISVNDLPADVNSINGVHNGQNYLAYTYYLKNVGSDTVTYEYYMYITNVTNNVDKAIRIRIFRDNEPITYARTRSDGSGAEYGTTEFLTQRSIVRNQVKNFKPNDITKFTVVIWLEGDDADCIDELIGGSLKTDMLISVVESDNAEGNDKNI